MDSTLTINAHCLIDFEDKGSNGPTLPLLCFNLVRLDNIIMFLPLEKVKISTWHSWPNMNPPHASATSRCYTRLGFLVRSILLSQLEAQLLQPLLQRLLCLSISLFKLFVAVVVVVSARKLDSCRSLFALPAAILCRNFLL